MRRKREGGARAGRHRLLAVALAVGAAAVVGAVAAPPPALAHHTGPCETYTVEQDLGLVHTAVESRAVQNNTSSTIPVTFTSSVAQVVSTTWTSNTTISGGVSVSVINASVSVTLGVSTTNSVTTTIGVNVGPIQVPPGNTLFGDWGVFRYQTQGTYRKIICSAAGHTRPPELAFGTAFSPVAQGWKVWQV